MTIWYLRPTNGSDVAAGTSFANAFKTFQKCADSWVAGDTLRMCPEAVETTAVIIDLDTTSGTAAAPITIETGNTTDGSRDMNLTYTIQASASIARIFNFPATTANSYLKFFNLVLDGNGNATKCVESLVDGASYLRWFNCRFTGATSDGVGLRSSTGQHKYFKCEFDNNGGVGASVGVAARGDYMLYHCKIHDNTGDGVLSNAGGGDGIMITRCEIYGNGANGILVGSSGGGCQIIGNTIYNNAGDGIELYNATSRHNYVIYHNSIVDNGGYGVFFQAGDPDIVAFMDYNHTHNNASGASDLTLPGDNNVVGDPKFTNVGTGFEDFTPLPGSPLIAVGM